VTDVRDLQQLVEARLADLGDRRGPLSARAAAARSEGKVSYETLRLIARGEHSGKLSDDTVAGLALALDVPRSQVLAAMGRTMSGPMRPFEAPDRWQRLTHRQRQLVVSVGDALLAAYEQGREDEAEANVRRAGEDAAPKRLRAVASGQRSPEAQAEARAKARRARRMVEDDT
jgi:hypothetical protein